MEHETGGGAVVAGVQPLRQGADVDALVMKLLDGPESLREVPRQAVDPRDHHRVPGFQHPFQRLHADPHAGDQPGGSGARRYGLATDLRRHRC